MDTNSRNTAAIDSPETAASRSLTISSGLGGNFRMSSFNRSSPRTRRDTLPSSDSHSSRERVVHSLLRTTLVDRGGSTFKARKEGRGLASWINRVKASYFSKRRLPPWILLVLVWCYIGFHLHTKWTVPQENVDLQAGDSQRLAGFRVSDSVGHSASRLGLNETGYSSKQSSNQIKKKLRLNSWLTEWLPKRIRNGAELDRESRFDQDMWVTTTYSEEDLTEAEEEPRNPLNDIRFLDVEGLPVAKEEIVLKGVGYRHNKSTEHLRRTVGPFDEFEKRLLGTVYGNGRTRHCPSKGRFPDFVKTKNFVMVFHELSMTGAPLAVLELASKIVDCGGKVSAIVLNRKGGLYNDLVHRGISIIRDKLTHSWKAAAGADLVVAGSAACNSWIGEYLRFNKKGGERIIWWLMENRREYFDRSRLLLSKARALVFLSKSQKQLWRQWAAAEFLMLPSIVEVVSLSVNDALAAAAGLDDEGGTNAVAGLETEKKLSILRNQVREAMGLQSSDFLVICLSSINPGKGQLLMLQAALMVAEVIDKDMQQTTWTNLNDTGWGLDTHERRKSEGKRKLKLLLGSVGSKSNKIDYLEKIYELVDDHPRLREMLLWTDVSVHVTPLYAAADAYVMNAQGIGETFGRVTIEAMAFGLPVLGTDAGGTKEIVLENITGLLHPAGHMGIPILAQNLQWVLNHPEVGRKMGENGRNRVHQNYREGPMCEAMTSVFLDSLRESGGEFVATL